jgi:pimeloyl-ACP methyl ester carboxylesterase
MQSAGASERHVFACRWRMRGGVLTAAIAVFGAILLSGAAGCVNIPRPTPAQLARGYVWMAPGIEGSAILMKSAYEGLRDAGVDCAIEVYEWPNLLGPLENLIDPTLARSLARAVAPRIAQYRRTHPDKPLHLLGYSGGGALAVFIAEELPEDTPVDNIVLVQVSLSREYDLSKALRRVRGRIVNLHAPLDVIMLGMGTTVFGTMDRKHAFSAGKDGFDLEKAVRDPAERQRVEQQSWSTKALWSGHMGTHMGLYGRQWNKEYVAMYLLDGLIEDEPMPEDAR